MWGRPCATTLVTHQDIGHGLPLNTAAGFGAMGQSQPVDVGSSNPLAFLHGRPVECDLQSQDPDARTSAIPHQWFSNFCVHNMLKMQIPGPHPNIPILWVYAGGTQDATYFPPLQGDMTQELGALTLKGQRYHFNFPRGEKEENQEQNLKGPTLFRTCPSSPRPQLSRWDSSC